jgi:uncharacterized protein YraI
MSSERLEQGIALLTAGEMAKARELFAQLVAADLHDEMAWLWYASTLTTRGDVAKALEDCLHHNPDCTQAERRLAVVKGNPPTPVQETHEGTRTKADVRAATKQCPYCAETIKAAAKLCRYCGKDIATQTDLAAEKPEEQKRGDSYVAVQHAQRGTGSAQVDTVGLAAGGDEGIPHLSPVETTKAAGQERKAQNNRRSVRTIGAIAVMVGACCCLAVLLPSSNGDDKPTTSALTEQGSAAVRPTRTPAAHAVVPDDVPAPTRTRVAIVSADTRERDGLAFHVRGISRTQDESDRARQIVVVRIWLRSGNVGWTGFDVRSSELIVDDESGRRHPVQSASPECDLRDDQGCITHVTIVLPIDVSRVRLYYVSDRRLGSTKPIDVTDPDDRRFIAEIDLQSITFEPTTTATASTTPTPTSTPSATATATPAPIGFVIVLGESVNLRAGPGTGFEIVGNANNGDDLPVYAECQDGSWLRLDWQEQVWIAATLVQIPEEIAGLPTAPTFTPTSTPTATPTPSRTPTPNYTATARARANAHATATIEAYVWTPPVGTWCSTGSGRSVCVADFRYVNCISYTCSPSNGRFIAFGVGVRNISSGDITVNPNDVTLVMEDGRSYAYASETYSYWSTPLEHVAVAPGDSAQGGVVFLVPNQVGPGRVIYRGGWFEAEVVLNLQRPPDSQDN